MLAVKRDITTKELDGWLLEQPADAVAPAIPFGRSRHFIPEEVLVPPSLKLRAQLSARLRRGVPPAWSEFATLWMAFNALYGGQPDARERSRAMACVRKYVPPRKARHVLEMTGSSIAQLISLPPGNMKLERTDLAFRAASQRAVRLYRSRTESPEGQLAGVAAILYQVRCNLLHGSKDPNDRRDRMLVRNSVEVLRILLPPLEAAVAAGD